MRVFIGLIFGVVLTVGTMFVADHWSASADGSAMSEHRAMVNWDVVGDNMRIVRQRAHAVWSTLSHKLAG